MSAPRVGLALEHPGRGFGYVRHMNAALWKEIAALADGAEVARRAG